MTLRNQGIPLPSFFFSRYGQANRPKQQDGGTTIKIWQTRRPYYSKLYPGVEIPDEVLQFLKQSDRKIDYLEHGIKCNRYVRGIDGKYVKDSNDQPAVLPELEISLDKLIEEGWDFPTSTSSPEEEVISKMEIEELYRCLDQLSSSEKELIDALFFSNDGKGMSEREYSRRTGIPRKTIAYRKSKILEKLKF